MVVLPSEPVEVPIFTKFPPPAPRAVVSTASIVSAALALWTWKADELVTWTELVLVKVLAAFFRGTLLLRRASLRVPEATLEALRLVRLEPSKIGSLPE